MELVVRAAIFLTALLLVVAVVQMSWKRKREGDEAESRRLREGLQKRHVVVTGGSSGIGLAIAMKAFSHGAYVSLISRDLSKLRSASLQILTHSANNHDRIHVKAADVGNAEQVKAAIEECFSWRPIDILVCSAGISSLSTFDKFSAQVIEKIVRTNIAGTMYTISSALPLMKNQSSSTATAYKPKGVVIMGSIASFVPVYGSGLYTASKHALRGLAETLRLELLPYNITVTLVCPGHVNTPMLDSVTDSSRKDSGLTEMRKRLGIEPRFGVENARDVARMSLEGFLKGRFLVTTGVKGYFLSLLSTGLFPPHSLPEAFMELILLLPARIATYFIFFFFTLVLRSHAGCRRKAQ
eukprot:TRINITY_DN25905_c0_g1_i1.p1 TRINITY_DN25905_c0_g1~~TRINITY_DN25905_c0_g1_i1.p1  ORF type:complete len:387 (+),score=80.81 TRINITY_DN25905_c0_g1_i1:101-1162(+)